MNAPRVSRPREPGLFARAPALERYRVAAGGLTLVALQPGDSLQVIDLEGRQPCELLAVDTLRSQRPGGLGAERFDGLRVHRRTARRTDLAVASHWPGADPTRD